MTPFEDEEIDKFFKVKLSDPVIIEVDEDWARMERVLRDKKGRSSLIYIWRIAGVAACLGIYYLLTFNSETHLTNPKKRIAQNQKSIAGAHVKDTSYTQTDKGRNFISTNEVKIVGLDNLRVLQTSKSVTEQQQSAPKNIIKTEASSQKIKDTNSPLNDADVIAVLPNVAVNLADTTSNPDKTIPVTAAIPDSMDTIFRSRENILSLSNKGGRVRLAFFVAPDFSAVNSLRNTQIGYAVGSSLIYRINNKLSADIGIAFGNKLYDTDFKNYKPNSTYVFPVQPIIVDANCTVLDLPLNISYRLAENKFGAFALNAGISSYVMLKEKYLFYYQNVYARAPRRYEVKNENKHYLSVANIGVSYQRQIRGYTHITFSPYLKLPLTDIGYGNVKLNSAGLSIGVQTSFKRFTQ